MRYYIGIDVGGTFVKGGVADAEGRVLCKDSVPTRAEDGADAVLSVIASLADGLICRAGIDKKDVAGLGAGVPGIIDSSRGIVLYNNNLGWKKVAFTRKLGALTGLPVRVSNDANVAALGETKFGAAAEYDDVVMLTLGTGVGGGIILGGRLFEGHLGCGAELGHMVIRVRGNKCTCGRRGCLETYASATALTDATRRAAQKNPDGALYRACGGNLDAISAKTAWDLRDTDPEAHKLTEDYVKMLAEGMANFANIFRPQVILLGGGVSKQGDRLIDCIQPYFKKFLYAGKRGPAVDLRIASLGNDAGFLGGIALAQM